MRNGIGVIPQHINLAPVRRDNATRGADQLAPTHLQYRALNGGIMGVFGQMNAGQRHARHGVTQRLQQLVVLLFNRREFSFDLSASARECIQL